MSELTKLAQPGDFECEVSVGDRTRSYLVHLPPEYRPDQDIPVVLVLHGGGSTPEAMIPFTGMNEQADASGFAVVYPRGTGRVEEYLSFNAGNCCGHAHKHQVDDVGFIQQLLDDLKQTLPVDLRRVYVAGMSNGGMMAYRLANELADRIAAIASVAGPMGIATCEPARPVPVIHFHGTEDQFTPLDGGVGDRSLARIDFYSVRHTIDCWVAANGCNPRGKRTLIRGTGAQAIAASRTVYGDGRQGSEVVLYKINGGGHTWPGRQPRYEHLGASTRDVLATEIIWEFFARHPLPSSP